MHMAHLMTWLRRHKTPPAGKRPRTLRMWLLLSLGFLAFLGWCLLHPATTQPGAWASRAPFSIPGPITVGSGGQGAGGSVSNATNTTNATETAGLCNPFDPSCYTNAVGQYLATQIMGALQPVNDFYRTGSANIITQTPAADSYANSMIVTLNGTFVAGVDAALACLLLIGGYNVILGQHLKMQQSSITELIPRAILVVAAVHFNLTFLGLFIDLNNTLCTTVSDAASTQILTNIISGFLSIDPLTGLMLVILVIVLLIMAILLLFQMVVRIALLALLIVLAPLGLACFALPQTMRWGRLWMTTFSSTVLVQFLQVTALGLGDMFVSSIGSTFLGHVGQEIGTVLLAIGTMVLVLKIPGMLQTWALHPMMDASKGVSGDGGGGEMGNSAMGSQGGGSEIGTGSSSMAASSTGAQASQASTAAQYTGMFLI